MLFGRRNVRLWKIQGCNSVPLHAKYLAQLHSEEYVTLVVERTTARINRINPACSRWNGVFNGEFNILTLRSTFGRMFVAHILDFFEIVSLFRSSNVRIPPFFFVPVCLLILKIFFKIVCSDSGR